MPGDMKKNVLASYVSQAITALMGIAFIPLYIHYLGMEAYGLIGVFALITAIFGLFDMGMPLALNREAARWRVGNRSTQSMRNLVRSMELAFLCLGLLAIAGIWAISGWMSTQWLEAQTLPPEVIQSSLLLMGCVVVLRWGEVTYRNALMGLQHVVWVSGATALMATVRAVGAVAVLAYVSSDIQTFFIWQCIVSVITATVFGYRTHTEIGDEAARARFDWSELHSLGRFVAGLTGVTVLWVLISQVDAVILSRMLPLEVFGYYTLAAVVGKSLYHLVVPLSTVSYPRFSALLSNGDMDALVTVYSGTSQAMAVIMFSVAFTIAAYANEIIYYWSQNADISSGTSHIVVPMVMGTALNGVIQLPIHLQLASGKTGPIVSSYFVALMISVPSILILVDMYGAVGGAYFWLLLNLALLFLLVPLVNRSTHCIPLREWYVSCILLPATGAFIPVAALRWWMPDGMLDRQMEGIAWVLVTALCSAVSAMSFSSNMRKAIVWRFLNK